MLACYWFHPAAWFVARRVIVTRELATDQSVVRAGCDRDQYATGLLEVLQRVGSRASASSPRSLAVAMSGFAGIEQRLTWILRTRPMQLPATRGGLLLLALSLLAMATTVQLRWTQADDEVQQSVAPDQEDKTPVDALDHDLFERMHSSSVIEVSDEDYEVAFSISGQVVSDAGKPVAGAIVVLRESSNSRINADYKKYLNPASSDFDWLRTDDVFAKTQTDADGKFMIQAARAPAMPHDWTNTWNGSLVAGHPELGVGWTLLTRDNELLRVMDGLTVRLKATGTIEGQYVTPAGEPLVNQMVQISRLEAADGNDASPTRELDLQASQLTPRVITDEHGRFRFSGLPAGYIASVGAARDRNWVWSYVAVATSPEVAIGELPPEAALRRSWSGLQSVVGSPFGIVADPGVQIRGVVVDDRQQPVPNVEVSYGPRIILSNTNEQGEFELRLKTNWLSKLDEETQAPINLHVLPKNRELLATNYGLTPEELQNRQAVKIELRRGTRVVGKVLTTLGLPCEGIAVFANDHLWDPRDITDPSGEFELYLSPGNRNLTFATDSPGFRLPTINNVRQAEATSMALPPTRNFEIIPGKEVQIETVIVETTPVWQVQVLLPDGIPAVGASLVVIDRRENFSERRTLLKTDAVGLATLGMNGDLNDGATPPMVEALYSTADKSYSGMTTLGDFERDAAILPQQIELVEDWLVRGRVLVNGQPVAGAEVMVGETRPTGDFTFETSNFRRTTTNLEGRWQVRVRAERQYSASLAGVPEIEERITTSHPVAKLVEGILEAADFEITNADGEIAGMVVDHVGNPIAGAQVSINPNQHLNPHMWTQHDELSQRVADKDGRFVLRKVPEGNYELYASLPDQRMRIPQLFRARTGDTEQRIIVDTRPAPVARRLPTLRIVDSPEPAPDSAQQDEPSEATTNPQPKDADAASVITNPVEIRGSVVDSKGLPLSGITLRSSHVTASGITYRSHPQATAATTTDGQGGFVALAGDVISRIVFRIEVPDFAPQDIAWDPGMIASLKVQMRRGATISGRLVGPDGPIAGAKLGLVQTVRSLESLFTPREAVTGDDGQFAFEDLPAAMEYAIYTHLDQEIAGVLPVCLISTPEAAKRSELGDVRAELARAFTLTVQTLDESPLPEDTTVYVNRRLAGHGKMLRLPPAQNSKQSFTLPAVGEELLNVTVRAKGYRVIRTLPNIAPDMSYSYPLRFPETKSLIVVLVPEDGKP